MAGRKIEAHLHAASQLSALPGSDTWGLVALFASSTPHLAMSVLIRSHHALPLPLAGGAMGADAEFWEAPGRES